jgi:hypothetical protein
MITLTAIVDRSWTMIGTGMVCCRTNKQEPAECNRRNRIRRKGESTGIVEQTTKRSRLPADKTAIADFTSACDKGRNALDYWCRKKRLQHVNKWQNDMPQSNKSLNSRTKVPCNHSR